MQEQDYILFEDYLEGQLSEQDRNAFEERLSNDPEFKNSFLTYKELSGFLENSFKDELEAKAFEENLRNISNKHFNKKEGKTKVIKFKPWQYAIAASIVVLFGLLFFNNVSDPTYDDFADYNRISLMERGETGEMFSKAENAFNSDDFINAIRYFNQILEVDNNHAEIQLYKGIALIEVNEFAEADKLLEQLSLGNSIYKHKAKWYHALSKLKQNKYDACKDILNEVPEQAEEYKQAKKLLRKL